MVTHLSLHYPKNPANQSQITQDKGKSPLNVVQVIPSRTKDEMGVPIQEFTWAQAKENLELQKKELEQLTTKKQKRKMCGERKDRRVAKKIKEEEAKQ